MASSGKPLKRLPAEPVREPQPRSGAMAVLCVGLLGGTKSEPLRLLRERLEKLVWEHGGEVRHPESGRLLAFWGTQGAREEDSERSVRAALAVKEQVAALRRSEAGGAHFSFRAGLDTGPAQLEAAGASGAAVRRAGRLEGLAPEGGILLSENTYRHIRGVFDVSPRETLLEEGGRGLRLFLLERVKPRAFRIPVLGVGNIETRTVGRERELEALQGWYRKAAGESRTHVAVVAGDAGVGKSRLLHEFEKWLELLPEGIFFFEGRATPEMGRRPNGILRDLFSFRFEIRDSDGVEKVRDKFRAGLKEFLDPARADVLGHWLGFDFSSSASVTALLGSRSFSQQAVADLCAVFRSLAAEPTVVFLEDLHWADDGSLDMVERLASEVPDRKLLFVCLARPSLFDRRAAWGEGREAFSRLDLAPLTEARCRDLVEEILQRADAVPESLPDIVVRGSQGNPYFVEEMILLLIDRGVILTGEERWAVDPGKLSEVKVPKTLREVLAARLECLPPRERLLLQCASVVGRQFWDAAVAELSGGGRGGETDVPRQSLLETALERQLIYPARVSSFEDAREFAFKHAIMRDYVYETVLAKMKRVYHAGTARWLERSLKDRQAEHLPVIADHFEAAGEPAKAAAYLTRSGEELVKVSAFKEAASTFERALALLPPGQADVRAVLLTDLGDSRRVMGQHEEARRCLLEALRLSHREEGSLTEVAALNALARTEIIEGAYAEAKAHLGEALKLASQRGYREGVAKVLLNLADVSFRLGDSETAISSGQESLKISSELGDVQGVAGAHRVLGFATMMRGDLERAAGHHAEGLEIFKTAGDRWGVCTCLINLGEVHRKMGRVEEAVEFWEKSLPIAREIGAQLSVAISHVNTGGALAALEGQEERALENLRQALKEALAIGALPIALEGLVSIALIHAREGQQPLAARILGLVTSHPSFNAEIQSYSDPVMRQLKKRLGQESLTSLLDQGRSLDLESVVREITRAPAQPNRS